MTNDDQHPSDSEPNSDHDAALDNLLDDPAMWQELDASLEDSIVAAIAAEAAMADDGRTPPLAAAPSNVTAISFARRWGAPIASGIAAALIVIIGFVALTGDDSSFDVELAMDGTDLAPAASADLAIEATPNGTRLVLDVTGLPPAPEGQVYEAWMRKDAEVGVSAGTFHMRGGDGDLELWSGVTIEDYPLITVTLQEEADTESSGEVVLRALVEE